MDGVRAALSHLVETGALDPDKAQARAAAALDRVLVDLSETGKSRWFTKPKAAKGLYLWGGVGRGKSMLMDMFFDRVPGNDKRRVHFHDFMLETHDFISSWRKLDASERKRSEVFVRGANDDPIPPAAKRVASQARVLCFDEFQVTDIADAMLLGRFYEQLVDRGVTLVATSNRHPDDLYKDGINRQLFIPFISLLKASNEVLELRAERDYRLERLEAAPVYYTPLGLDADQAMAAAFTRLTLGATPRPCHIAMKGRELEIPVQAAGVAKFTFPELCARPLGAADYLAVARQFHTVLIEGVPLLGPENRNQAKRFVTLIDALYEARTKVLISAAAEPKDLYPEGDGSFEFERTASRLYEMRSHDYLAAERETGTDT